MRHASIIRSTIFAAVALAAAGAWGASTVVNGITWNYIVSDGEAEICNYYPSAWTGGVIFEPAISTSTTGAITIPSRLGGYPVRHISRSAFEGCSGLTSVTIPDSVTSIGPGAFAGCSGLTSVTIPGSVTIIADSAFAGCSGLTSVTIPNGVRNIGEGAFYGCSGLTSVTIPNGVTSIGSSAFSGCSGLTSVAIPNSVNHVDASVFEGCNAALFDTTTISGCKLVDGWVIEVVDTISGNLVLDGVRGIGDGVFSGCSGLTKVTIPNSVTRIGSSAFAYCGGLTSVLIGNGVKTIDDSAFSSCTNLTRVTIPNSVTSIGAYAFYGCSGLEEITLPFVGECRGNSGSVFSEFGYLFGCFDWLEGSALPTASPGMGMKQCYHQNYSTNALGGRYIYYYHVPLSLKSVMITDETFLDNGAFFNCSTLTNVTIGSSVTSIGKSAFSYCYNLKSITMPNSVTSIGSDAFNSCRLTSITIPDSVTRIGEGAFSYCGGLKEVHITDLAKWCEISFDDNPLRYAGKLGKLFLNGSLVLGDMTIPDGVKSIGNYAFYGCSGLTSVTIPDSVRRIGDEAFWGCDGLTSVTVPQCVCNRKSSSVFPSAYQSITNVVISSSVTSIGGDAFDGCYGLTSVTIPKSVTSIGVNAFSGCNQLREVRITDIAKWCEISFDDNPLCHAGNLFLNGLLVSGDMIIPDGVKSVGNYAFYGCSGLTSVTIPDSVTSIGSSAFSGCSCLTSVTIPDNITSIEDCAFSGCSGVTAFIVDAANVKYKSVAGLLLSKDGKTLIAGVNVRNLDIPDGVTNICSYAFFGCSKLAAVTIPTSVTSIGDWAFSGCSGLTSVTVPSSVINIGSSAFSGCGGLEEITLPFVGARRGDTGRDSLFGYIFGTLPYVDGIETEQCYSSYSSTSPYSINPYCTSYYIPSKLKKVRISDETLLGYGVFYNCSGLTSVTIPSRVTNIGDSAFSSCGGLTRIKIPYGVTSIGAYAFSRCSGLASVTIPSSVTNICSGAFSQCHGLTSVTIPDSVTSIGDYAFSQCYRLTGITIPPSVTLIGSSPFSNCSGLTSVIMAGNCPRRIVSSAFSGVSSSCVAYLPRDDDTYSVVDGKWYGMMVVYCDPVPVGPYTITFDANGGVGGTSVTLDYGAVLAAPTVTREGYTFKGWSPSVSTIVPAANLTYTARWLVNKYKVTFDANGGTGGKEVTLDCGAVLDAPTVTRVGYTFVGWSPDIPATVPASNVTYLAQWKINQYSVTFDANGGNGGTSVTLDYGAALTAPTVTREGYTFMGWTPNVPTAVPACDVTYTAQWEINRYTVTFDANGGVGLTGMTGSGILTTNSWKLSRDSDGTEEYQSQSIDNGASPSMVLTLVGPYELTFSWKVSDSCSYDYMCWYLDGTEKAKIWGGDRLKDVSVSVPIGEHTVKWTFFKDGRDFNGWRYGWVRVPKIMPSVSLDHGQAIGELPTPTRTGYTFEGWFTEATGGTQISASTVVTENMTCYAHWACVVTFNANGGSVDESIRRVVAGSTVGTLPTPTRTGYSFAGWWTAATGGTQISASTVVAGDMTCFARWKAIYTVTFDANGGSVDESSRRVVADSTVGTLPTPTRTGYSFAGWWTSATGGAQISASTKITGAVTYYAHWAVNQCQVTFNANGGSVIEASRMVAEGGPVGTLPTPTRSGYIFDGWFTSESEGTQISASTVISCAVTYYAHWTWTDQPILTIDPAGVLTGVDLNGYTDIVVPVGVTSIGSSAFKGCSGLTSVTIPNSVTSIGAGAFEGCSGLEEITLPFVGACRGDAGRDDSLFGYIFGRTSYTGSTKTWQQYSSSWYAYYIPSSLRRVVVTDETVLGYGAFSGCSGLTSVTMPDSVTSIGSYAFYDCSGLTSVTIPDSVTSINNYTFYNCSCLTIMTIPDSVTSIGSGAFEGCRSLTSMTMPDSVTSIGDYAFEGCSGLTSVTIPEDVTSIGFYAFYGCSGLMSVYVTDIAKWCGISFGNPAANPLSCAKNLYINGSLVADLTIPDSVTNIGEYVFSGWCGLMSVTMPDSVTSIGPGAFAGCSGLTSVTIPNSVTNIGGGAFSDCSSITSVTIPDSVTSIGHYAFYGCSGIREVAVPQCVCTNRLSTVFSSAYQSITNVVISDSVTSIGDCAFIDCSGLTSVAIPDSVTNIGSCVFQGCSGIREVVVPQCVCNDELRLVFSGAPITNVVISDSVTDIGSYAFYNCSGLTSVTIPDSVTSIGNCAFSYCGGLASIVVPNSVTNIGRSAFSYCGGLTSVTIPDRVTSIGGYAFYYCSGLTSVTIPGSVTSIGEAAFSGCSGLTSVYVSFGDTDRVKELMKSSGFYGTGVSFVELGSTATRVVFDANGGSVNESSRSVAVDGVVGALPTPTRNGYKFVGWFTAAVGGSQITASTKVTASVIYYAHWQKNGGGGAGGGDEPSTPTTYTVTYRPGASGTGSQQTSTKTKDVALQLKGAIFSRTGYTQTGWATSDGGAKAYGLGASYSGNAAITLYPAWTVNQYTVTFNANGGTGGKTMTLNYGAKLTAPTVTRTGYTFAGWSPTVPATVPAINTTYTAQWTKNQSPIPEPDPTPEPEELHELYEDVDGAAPAVASEYNGYLYDEKSGAMKGTIQVKVGKPGKKDGKASVKATVIIGSKKVILKAADKGKAEINPDGPTEIELVGGDACIVVFGGEGVFGTYGAYLIDGARNFFTSKAKDEVSAANAILAKWLGSFMVIWDGGTLSVSIAAKGKVKVSGTLANGAKVSVGTAFLVGEEWSCISVAAQKANLAFVLWLSHDGKTIEVEGLGEDVHVGLPGTLANGATFQIDSDEFAAVFGQAMLPYLPDGVPVKQSGTKWTLPKAGKVAYKNGAVDESKLGENPCGLKLTYKAKDGTFKGSFKVYAEVKGKPKATTVNVTGFMLNGVGYGTATIKGKKSSVAVTIE